MKKIVALLFILGIVGTGFSKETKVTYADEINPAQRKKMSEAWVETGQAYLDAGDKKNAKASFNYAIKWFSMGTSAQQARTLLKKNFGETVSYDAEKEFAKFVKRAKELKTAKHSLNNYLMALEIKQDKEILYMAAKKYYELGDTTNAADYLQKALAAGYPVDKVDSKLSSLSGN